ncbi:MAG: DUF2919 family protein [Burkholderiales bacterium]|nr:DUF2919 family protein [Burkholderiales bacterium]
MATIDERLLHVDRHGALSVPAALWLAMVFLCRYWIVVVVVFASARRSPDTIRLLGQDFAWFMLAIEVPVMLVLATAGRRKPDASAFWRAVWHHGRTILIAVAVAHLAVAAFALASSGVFRRWPELFIASCAVLDLAVITALVRDGFFRQLFADFPAPAQAASPT